MTSRVGSWTRSHRKTRLNQTVRLRRVFWCDHGYDPTHLNKTVLLSRVFRWDRALTYADQTKINMYWEQKTDGNIILLADVKLESHHCIYVCNKSLWTKKSEDTDNMKYNSDTLDMP